MRYKSRQRRGGRRPGPGTEDSFDDRSDIPIEPLRSMTMGDDSTSSDGSRSPRFDSSQSMESSDLRSSGAWVRPEPGWEDQPSNVRRRSKFASSGLFRRSSGGPSGPGTRSRFLVGGLAAVVLLAGTAAVAIHQRNAGNATPPANKPPAVTLPTAAATLGAPVLPGQPSAAVSAQPSASAPAAATAQVALDTMHPTVVADGKSGGRSTAVVLGSANFAEATSVFVNCAAKPATLTYQLDKQFTRLTAVAGLTGNATPGDLVARIVISGDGKQLATEMVSLDRNSALSINLTGVTKMVITAQRATGTCQNAGQPYGVLGSATLRR